MRKPVVFTDLDETLLERRTYSFDKAFPALKLLKEKDIPLVICSSKTRAEVEVYRKKLENAHPFVVENGGGIFIPRHYFEGLGGHDVFEEGDCLVIHLGIRYERLREALSSLKGKGFALRGFGDMGAEEISGLTGLSPGEARLAKDRHFDEPFVFDGDRDALREAVKKMGLRLSAGRLYHLTGRNDKGKAVEILMELYRKKCGEAVFIALGDSPTDSAMLRKVDYPVLVQKEKGSYDRRVVAPNLILADGIGPEGWNRAVMELIAKLSG